MFHQYYTRSIGLRMGLMSSSETWTDGHVNRWARGKVELWFLQMISQSEVLGLHFTHPIQNTKNPKEGLCLETSPRPSRWASKDARDSRAQPFSGRAVSRQNICPWGIPALLARGPSAKRETNLRIFFDKWQVRTVRLGVAQKKWNNGLGKMRFKLNGLVYK